MRIALASYRSHPHSGGQGVYVRNLSRELVALGHRVEVFSGPPYPDLDPGVGLTQVPSLDLYRPDDPFRRPSAHEFRSGIDALEYLIMCTAGFPEPRTFSLRLARMLRSRIADFDILHDNQTLGPGVLDLERRGMPLLTTIHHPISRDRRLDLSATTGWQRLSKRRWYGFVRMQRRVARRSTHLLTVSQRSADDIAADFAVPRDHLRVVPVGVDVDRFRPPVDLRVPGRLVTVASADVPLKGLGVLVRALPHLPEAAWSELVVVGAPSDATSKMLAEAGVIDRVTFRSGLSDDELATLVASAEVHVVASLYEGFSLPAVEAMSCGTPVVASDVGALPELVAGDAGALVPAGDVLALAAAIGRLTGSPRLRRQMGDAGRRRAVAGYSWRSVATQTARIYAEVIAGERRSAVVRQASGDCTPRPPQPTSGGSARGPA